MKKWDKLNKQLDEVLAGLSQEDWIKWDKERTAKKEIKKKILLEKSAIQASKISNTAKQNFK